ncbi:MAG TPA: hypothetical protein VFQ61_22555 [Polyangiaceae bacterium]|nr:hypothetical protein [Polyangiaceae bacterium]
MSKASDTPPGTPSAPADGSLEPAPKPENSGSSATGDPGASGAAELGSSGTPERAEKRTKKRRSKNKALPEVAPRRANLDAKGRERPRFLLEFPEDPELERLIGCFEAGNYRELRQGAPTLIERSTNPEIRAAAEELLRRIEPDPLMKLLLVAAIVLFICVVAAAYGSHV